MSVRIKSVPLLLVFFLGVAHSEELRYALFTSGPTGSFDSSGAVPAIELAEEMINADNSILSGYNLTHTPVVDTMVTSMSIMQCIAHSYTCIEFYAV